MVAILAVMLPIYPTILLGYVAGRIFASRYDQGAQPVHRQGPPASSYIQRSDLPYIAPSFVHPLVGWTLHKFGGVLGAQVTAQKPGINRS